MEGSGLDISSAALRVLLEFLRRQNYRFVTPTPATHARVNGRKGNELAHCVEDVFGWSRSFLPDLLPGSLFDTLMGAGIFVKCGVSWRSALRASSIDDCIFLHSAFPTTSADAVFFGPDTYRFVRAIKANLPAFHLRRAVDLGCGSGAGGIVMAKQSVCEELVLSDINPKALQLARANAHSVNLHEIEFIQSDLFAQLDGSFDLIVANPPYLNDRHRRVYRHGGGDLGSELSIRIADAARERLALNGLLILYTGSAIVKGFDKFKEEAKALFSREAFEFSYEEIDPDVFGEELEAEPYKHVDRVAAVVLTAKRI
jgi:methylase of polypeptide subunit release factors